jgi:hypothetical protein
MCQLASHPVFSARTNQAIKMSSFGFSDFIFRTVVKVGSLCLAPVLHIGLLTTWSAIRMPALSERCCAGPAVLARGLAVPAQLQGLHELGQRSGAAESGLQRGV